jgi:DNA-binding response OmpR family regulator
MTRILLVDDDVQLCHMVTMGLSPDYSVDAAHDATSALDKYQGNEFDLIILDWQLPDWSGIELAKALRDLGKLTPILMLTSNTGVDNTVVGLDAGADDYVTKPFDMKILKAKLKSLLRGAGGAGRNSVVQIAELTLDRKKHEVMLSGRPVKLRALEFEVLDLLMTHPERVFSLNALREKLWGGYCADDTIRGCIRRIRDELGSDGEDMIQTVPNMGYTIRSR